MVKPSFEAAKGTKDWYGQDTIIRNQIRNTLIRIFERYGYDRLETPMIERRDALGFKGGGEIQKEVFRLHDQGGRDLALRFDQTVPLARYIASTPDIKFPWRRYAVGEVFRDGPTQPDQGRYRIFTQCDVDVLGVKEMTAEAELFALAQDAFKALGLGGVYVNINNRKLLEGALDYAKVPQVARQRTIVTLDKMDKIGLEGVTQELSGLTLLDEQKGLSDRVLEAIFTVYDQGTNVPESPAIKAAITAELGSTAYKELVKPFLDPRTKDNRSALYGEVANYQTKGDVLLNEQMAGRIMEVVRIEEDNERTFARLERLVTSDRGREGLQEIRTLLDYSKAMGFDFIRLNPSLARGLDYYTGTTIEVYLQDKAIVSSAILAGGRFDDMVGDFRGGNESIPAVGFSFGLERLAMILGSQQQFPKTVRQLYLIPVGKTHDYCLRVAHDLRQQGLNVEMKLHTSGKVGKDVDYANKAGIPYVAFVGESEVGTGTVRIKNMVTGEQKDLRVSEVKDHIK